METRAMESPRVLIATTPTRWALRGFAVGVLVCAALNAASYFVRSDGLGNLIGAHPSHREALGFPIEVWEAGNPYDGYFIDLNALGIDALFAMAVGTALALVTLRYRKTLSRMIASLDTPLDAKQDESGGFRISLAGLFTAMVIAALGAMGVRYAMAGRAEVIGAIYLLGPWLLIAIAYLPQGLSWQNRVRVLVPCTVLLIAGAAVTSLHINPPLDFDKVLLGIFVCWTPQTVLVAIIHSSIVIAHLLRLPEQR